MIRTTAVPRPVRTGAAMLGIAGTIALAGCAAPAADAEVEPTTGADSSATSETTEAAGESAAASESTYADGSYTATGSYQTPESVEELTVTVTLADDIVTAVEVTGNPTKAESKQYQSQFIGGIADVVVGKDIDDLSVSRVAGSSLSSGGFNEAIEQIKADAAAAANSPTGPAPVTSTSSPACRAALLHPQTPTDRGSTSAPS